MVDAIECQEWVQVAEGLLDKLVQHRYICSHMPALQRLSCLHNFSLVEVYVYILLQPVKISFYAYIVYVPAYAGSKLLCDLIGGCMESMGGG
jgi:hypothetical protein